MIIEGEGKARKKGRKNKFCLKLQLQTPWGKKGVRLSEIELPMSEKSLDAKNLVKVKGRGRKLRYTTKSPSRG